MQLTSEQQAVIAAKGKVIVSASAGSGKTFVMIERVINEILNGAQVDRMLAVTFTNKAAAQMREKIQKALIKKINDETVASEQREMLQKQLNTLPMSEISTIHAFCAHLIRSHFFLADVESSFDIISDEDADGVQIKSEALDSVFMEAYEKQEPSFMRLLSVYYDKKSDRRLKERMLKIYDELRSHRDYKTELKNAIKGDDTLFDKICDDLLKSVKSECEYLLERLIDCRNDLDYITSEDKSLAKTITRAEQLIGFLQVVLNCENYVDVATMSAPSFEKKASIKKEKYPILREAADRLDYYKKRIDDLAEKHLLGVGFLPDVEKARLDESQKLAGILADYLLRFDERYSAMKHERAKLDYNDLEHITLQLLDVPEVADELKNKFDYIFVDEYQDVNPVQEEIVSRIAGENIFLVGDVKQSIYAFRGGKSKYFLQKQEEFEKIGKSLYLTANFRSSLAILGAVNNVFNEGMTKRTCGVEYREKQMLGGELYDGHQGRVALHYIEKDKDKPPVKGIYSVKEAYEEAKRRIEENRLCKEVYNIVREEYGKEFYCIDGKDGERGMHPVRYSDIAVLFRKKEGNAERVITYLTENGIPVSSANKVNLCRYPEIVQLIDILSLIDNREQDIPLCSALLSGMGGLSNEDLAAIRIRYQDNDSSFRECVRMYADCFENETGLKLRRFYDLLGGYVTLSFMLTAGELTERLISESGLEASWLSREGGGKRMDRVRAFISFMQDKNVHDFLQYLKDLDYDIQVNESSGEDAVKLLTMHASKGLEFPVVILIDLDKSFHGAERDDVVVSEKYGIAPKCYDEENKICYNTILRKSIDVETRLEELTGELNLLYVAMTRAKYSLHLIMEEREEKTVDPFYAKSYAGLLPESCFYGQIADPYPEVLPFERGAERQAIVSGENAELVKEILQNFAKRYVFEQDIDLPVKSSASEVMQERSSSNIEGVDEYFAPQMLVKEDRQEGVKKSEIGIAYHAFLQHAEFGKDGAEELFRMREKDVLPKEQLDLLSEEKCRQILQMPVFKRLQNAELHREQDFLVNLPAREMTGVNSDMPILYQGFIDLLAIGKEGVEVVDYKYSSRTAESLKEYYALQIKLYKKAVATVYQIDESKIRTTIVNIQSCEEIEINVE